MSKRHQHRQVVLPPKIEVRAHAHSERHRVNAKLHEVTILVSHGVEPDDVTEPGRNWKPIRHHDSEVGRELSHRPLFRHWKTKAWKRRKITRKQRAQALNPQRDFA